MVNREVVIGGIAGEMGIEAYKWMMEQRRTYGLEQFRRGERQDEFRVWDVFGSGGKVGDEYVAMMAYPEGYLWNLELERIIILSDTNPDEQPGDRRVVDLVMFRRYKTGPWKGTEHMFRVKMILDAHYASNRNQGRHHWSGEDLKPLSQEEIDLAEASGAVVEVEQPW